MRSKVIAVIAALTTSLAVAASPAAAQNGDAILRLNESQHQCPRGYVCIFQEYYFDGGGFAVASGYSLNDFAGIYFEDNMSSWINATGVNYCWYQQDNFNGIAYVMQRNSYVVAEGPGLNNTASSLAPC